MIQTQISHLELPEAAVERIKTLRSFIVEFRANNIIHIDSHLIRTGLSRISQNHYVVETMRFNTMENDWDDFSRFEFHCWELAIEFIKQICNHPTRKEDSILELSANMIKVSKFHRWAEWALFGGHDKKFKVINERSSLSIISEAYGINIAVFPENVTISNRFKKASFGSDDCYRPNWITFKGSAVFMKDRLLLDNKPV